MRDKKKFVNKLYKSNTELQQYFLYQIADFHFQNPKINI